MFGSSLVVISLCYCDSVKCYIHDDNIRLDHGCLAVALWL